ncbi:histidinol-phosphate transaminase [Legionella oakridgensis]|uniref:histidinol-phosphate transaminase n=1 Tax=Legionella oakridgensis TaxID=29423 RepID=UPI0003DE3814|nr:histidinol-phosphate transaminase [Legionella oakridgensis]ETO93647.1 histidinol-phosphate aminotransferase [Legionella oakridgensis RV-2-2007]
MSVLKLMRPDLAFIQTYSMNHESFKHKLDANELPWSPIISTDMALNHYPTRAAQQELQKQLAHCYQVDPEELLLTRGSDEGIDLLMRLFLRAGLDSILQCPPTFSMYAFYAGLQQAGIIDCPLQENDTGFQLSCEAIQESWRPDCKLIMLCRPNNPTGNLIELATIANLCRQFNNKAMIVVDEAYVEFSDAPSAATLISSIDNLIVLRTLSKAYGLAGLRLGAILAQPQVIQALQTITAPFTLSTAVIHLSLQGLKNKSWLTQTKQRMLSLRTELIAGLQSSPWIDKIYPTAANFVLIKTSHAKTLAQWFKQQSIAIRFFGEHSLLPHHLRITVGNQHQNAQLLSALNLFSGE